MTTNHNQWLLAQARLINDTAYEVYGAVQGGVKHNFFNRHFLYDKGMFGWIKENTSFEVGISIYEIYTSNEGFDVVGDILERFPQINEIDIKEFNELTREK